VLLREILGPQGTIAKESGERKEKSQKRPENCIFSGGHVEIAAKNAVSTHFWTKVLLPDDKHTLPFHK
jgi:hypothetical protein